jgi:hypothetical protein
MIQKEPMAAKNEDPPNHLARGYDVAVHYRMVLAAHSAMLKSSQQ